MAFDSSKKVTFGMGVVQTLTLSDWSPNQWGKIRYNTADGKFFDASPGLSNLLGEMNLAPNTSVTIEKRSNVGKDGTDYGRFYVNNLCIDDLKNGVAPSQAPPPVATQVNVPPVNNVILDNTAGTGAVTLDTINAKLDALVKSVGALKGGDNLPF